MTVGFQSFTDAGKLQFAAVDRQDVYVFTEKGSGTSVSTAGPLANETGLAITLTTAPAVIATRCTGGPCEGLNLAQDPFSGMVLHCDAAGRTIDWWAFKRLRDIIVPSSAVGLQVWNADGSIAYHSNYKPCIIATRVPITTMTVGMAADTALPAGRNYASIFYGTSIKNRGLAFPDGAEAAYAAAQFTGGGSPKITIKTLPGVISVADVFGNGGALVIDVTDL